MKSGTLEKEQENQVKDDVTHDGVIANCARSGSRLDVKIARNSTLAWIRGKTVFSMGLRKGQYDD